MHPLAIYASGGASSNPPGVVMPPSPLGSVGSAQPFLYAYSRPVVPVGVGVPFCMYFPLQNDPGPSYVGSIDWTTVTSVYFIVTRQLSGTVSTWTATKLSSVTTGGLVATYPFATPDCPVAGVYFVRPYAVTPAGNVPRPSSVLYVVNP